MAVLCGICLAVACFAKVMLVDHLLLRSESVNAWVALVVSLYMAVKMCIRDRAARDKKVELIHVKELLPLTGYIRGGCSPIGMKKCFPTYIDETAILYDEIGVSAGQRGAQVLLNPESLCDYVGAEFCDLTV